jgi:hypothetical protein
VTSTALKSLLHSYLALLRSPGGAEKIGFALLQHIDHLTWREAYGGPILLRDLPAYRESAPRPEPEVMKSFTHTEQFPTCTPSTS